jgi:hypothetical protein
VIAELTEGGDESFWQSIGAQWPGFRPEDLRQKLESSGFQVEREETLGQIAMEVNGNSETGNRPEILFLNACRME